MQDLCALKNKSRLKEYLMDNLIEQYSRQLTVLHDPDTAEAIFKRGVHENEGKISAIVQPETVGVIAIFSDQENNPGKIVEIAHSLNGNDACMTLYTNDSIFGELSKLADLRQKLIYAISGRFMALPGLLTVMDEARGKKVLLREMGTAQLIDLLADYTN